MSEVSFKPLIIHNFQGENITVKPNESLTIKEIKAEERTLMRIISFVADNPNVQCKCLRQTKEGITEVCPPPRSGICPALLNALGMNAYNRHVWSQVYNEAENKYGLQCVIPKEIDKGDTFIFQIFNPTDSDVKISRVFMLWESVKIRVIDWTRLKPPRSPPT